MRPDMTAATMFAVTPESMLLKKLDQQKLPIVYIKAPA